MKKVVIFEVEGGNDKWINGHRKDTMPIAQALEEKGIETKVFFFRESWSDELFEACKDFDAYISRVNPGKLDKQEEKSYFDLLNKLSKAGLLGMSSPDMMQTFGAKDALVKVRHTKIVPDDTYTYYSLEELLEQFPKTLLSSTRVLKQNRGSTGSGIWKVQIEETNPQTITENTKIKITQALDNKSEHTTLGEFMQFCEQYIDGENGMIVDTPFMPRIVEGEIRILYVGETPIFVVHKKPAQTDGAFSATLFSGATYNYEKPENYQKLINLFESELPEIKKSLGFDDVPLIWTADFMLDTDENGGDSYVLGEINCSCVGFTSHLEEGIQEKIADEVAKRLDS